MSCPPAVMRLSSSSPDTGGEGQDDLRDRAVARLGEQLENMEPRSRRRSDPHDAASPSYAIGPPAPFAQRR